MKYQSVLKRSKVLIHVTWINLENIMLNETSQSQKDNIIKFHLHEVPRIVKFIETDTMVISRGLRAEEWRVIV